MNLNQPKIEIDFGTFAKFNTSGIKYLMINGYDEARHIQYLSDNKIAVQTTKIEKYLEIDVSYQSNFQEYIDATRIKVSLKDGNNLWKTLDYPIKLLKEELQLLHSYREGNTLKLNFVLDQLYFPH